MIHHNLKFVAIGSIAFFLLWVQTAGAQNAKVNLSAKDTAEVRFLNNRKFYLYQVGKGESLFSISQKFGIPQDELQELNPDLKKGLKSKMKLWIPAYSWKKKSGEKDDGKDEKANRRDPQEIKVAVVAGLFLPRQDLREPDPSDTTALEEVLEEDVRNSLLFTEGIQYALEQAIATDHRWKVKLAIVDAGGDTVSLAKALTKAELKDVDAVITNLNGGQLRLLNRWCLKQKIRLLSTSVNSTDPVRNNPMAVVMLPSSLLQCNRAGTLTAKRFPGANVVLVKTALPRENERSSEFRDGWKKQFEHARFRTYDYAKLGADKLQDSLSKGKSNVIFLPSSNEDLVTAVLNKTKELKADYELKIVGLPTWMHFETIDAALMESAGVELFTSAYLQQDFPDQTGMRKTFRDRYSAEPDDNALLGADAIDVLLNGWKKSGDDFPDDASLPNFDGRYCEYQFSKTEAGACMENMNIRIWEFRDRKPVEFGR
ncbi:MAG: ABC transporter substrate-binding protein [Bacteroidia bacterium]|nr:ABC transporter substrate-binding protein [Bacteroidia bacterium]MBP7269820.1 ABC transporter substrate-binding protein [Bacteroidia bacterium]MBP7436755.1 ABC transporter substrate-binding protein [Bacteroidia bacterium]